MNNLAICLSGSLRSIDICYKNFLENIYYPNNEYFNIKLFYFIPEDINSQKINKIGDILALEPTIKIKKDGEIKLPSCHFKGRPHSIDSTSIGGFKGWIYQIQGVENNYEMLNEYEKNNSIKFDYILRVRHDVLFLKPVILKDYINSESIIVPNFQKVYGINDRFAFGTASNMKTYMLMYSNLYKYSKDKSLNILNAEWFCKYNLDRNNIKYIEDNNILFNRVRIDGNISIDCK